jgi:hypothetical protein
MLAGGSFLLGALLAGCAEDAEPSPAMTAQREAGLPPDAPLLFFVSAPDCPYCAEWNRQFRASFESSDIRARLHFATLHVPTVRLGAYADEAWPEDLRWLRAELQKRQIRGALPMFVLVHNGAYVASVLGENPGAPYGWPGDFYPAVQKEIGLA